MSCRQLILDVDNDNTVYLDSLTGPDGEYVNNATVTAVLKDSTGTNVTGVSWPLTLAYITDSNGRYSGVIESVADLIDGATYILGVTATVDGDMNTYIEREVIALTRTE